MKMPYYSAGIYNNGERNDKRKGIGDIEIVHMPISAWLLHPYLDLGPLTYGPLHAHGLECAYQQIKEDDVPLIPFQIHPSPLLRHALITETGLSQYRIVRPEDLHPELRTESWQYLVEQVAQYAQLSSNQQLRLITLLDRLSLQAAIVQLIPEISLTEIDRDPVRLRLATKRTHAMAQIYPHARNIQANLDIMQRVALAPLDDRYMGLGAALNLVVHYAKFRTRNVAQVLHWSEVAGKHYQQLHPENDWLDCLYASTYWRAVSFVPYLAADKDATAWQLDKAEQYARVLPRTTPKQQVIYNENLHPLLETRTKEALGAGDLDLALERAQALVAHDPYDPKVHIGLGDVWLTRNDLENALHTYNEAVRLGVPHTPLAWFMVGYCLELLADLAGACDAYQQSLLADPNGVTPAERLVNVARSLGRSVIAEWGIARLNKLKCISTPSSVVASKSLVKAEVIQ